MEQTTLSQKSWYRGLKVLFVLAFLIAQGFGFLITYSITSEKVSFVKCDNGKEFANPYFLPDDKEKLDIFKQCDIATYFFNKSDVKGILTDQQQQELNGIVFQMQKQGALESEIQSAVDDFKTKNAIPNPEAGKKSYTAEELTKLYGHNFNDSFKVKDSNFWVANFTFQNKEKYLPVTKSIYYLLSFFIVSVIFWLLSRIFFYIFAKE